MLGPTRLFNNFIQSNISKLDVILKANEMWLWDANNKGAYQTAQKHGLVCAFVVRIHGCQDPLCHGLIIIRREHVLNELLFITLFLETRTLYICYLLCTYQYNSTLSYIQGLL